MLQAPRSRTRLVLLALLTLAARAASAEEPVTGRRFVDVASGAVDVLRMHQVALRAQLDRDEVTFAYEGTVRSMDATFVDRNGLLVDDTLARMGGSYWFGDGNPRTDTAWFCGFQVDGAIIGSGTLGALPYLGQGLVFVGGAVEGWQASIGLRGDHRQGVYPDGTFVEGLSVSGEAADETGRGGGGVLLTLMQAEGVSVGAVFDGDVSVEGGTDEVLAMARALVQPEDAIARAGLRDLGVPSLAVESLAAGLDTWGERAPGEAAPAGRRWETPLAIDDLAGLGFRVRAVPQLAPEPLFRAAEVGWVHLGETFQLGGRALAFRRDEDFTPAGEGFLTWVTGRDEDGTEGLAITFTYSRNVPDSTTFFAIPDADVLGLRFTVGPTEMARPLVPLLASQTRGRGEPRRRDD